MAMRCLIEGGLDAAYDFHQEALNVQFGDGAYLPNGDGFFALQDDFGPDFYAKYEGRLVKVPWGRLRSLPEGDYRVLFMLRDPKEISASMERFMPGWGGERVLAETCYLGAVNTLLAQLRARGDMEVTTLDYATVVKGAAKQLGALGWPIDSVKAASVVDESLHRFHLEAV
jgi:hypothetical protein